MLAGFEKIVEERILKTQKKGEFDNLPGSGKPLVFDDDRFVSEELRLAYKRDKYLLKAKLKQAKVEFALLITTDSPNKSSISSKIDQIVKLKKEKLHLKENHKINIRK